MNKMVRPLEAGSVPVYRQARVTRSDGTTYELPSYAEHREMVREQYKGDVELERAAARFAAEWQADEMTFLRSVGFDGLADMYGKEFDGAFMPAARWMREVSKSRQRSHEAKYRADHREQIREKDAKWRKDHVAEFDALRVSRPFVCIDSEGMDFDGDDIVVSTGHGDVLYKDHGTYVWCASTDDADKAVHVLAEPNSKGKDKRKLDVKTILDWLLSLPRKYDPIQINRNEQKGAIFCMFGSGYDITQLLAKTSLKTAHNVVRRVDYDDEDTERNAPEFWQEYAFSYIKGKWIDIWKLRDPDNPWSMKLQKGKRVRTIDASEHIKIYDTFGYFQRKFEDVVNEMVKRGMANDYEKALISKMKARRGIFANDPIEEITKYCLTECRLLAKQMGQIRDAAYQMELRPQGWHGPGAIANAAFKKRAVGKHFGEHIAASNISEQQDWAHHAFVGGRIESLRQGYLKSGALYVYDVASCYPAAIVELPSLCADQGEWKKLRAEDMRFDNLGELLATVEKLSMVSSFKVRWKFPIAEKLPKPPKHLTDPKQRARWIGERTTYIPFFPLAYRTGSGAILFPSSGQSICMRDDLIAAIKWMAKFTPDYPGKKTLDGQHVLFDIEGAWVWEEVEGAVRPFAFIQENYDQRRAIKDEAARSGVYNPMEIVIKLFINSVYGKLAQFIGEKGRIPKTANPYYAAAITAYGRRRLCEAAVVDPYAIVFFATDGIVATRPLHGRPDGLDRVKVEGRDAIGLGDWEFVRGDGGLFVGSGIYIYWKYDLDENGEPKRDAKGDIVLKPVSKMRGSNAKKYKTDATGLPWLVANVLPIWKAMTAFPRPGDGSGSVLSDYKQFVTVGSALSRSRWPIAGRWSPEPGEAMAYKRALNAHELGVKRMLNVYKEPELLNGFFEGGLPAKRTYELVYTRPTPNRDLALSRPRPPKWLDEETGVLDDEKTDVANVMSGSRGFDGWE
jgi:hypothetical protein